MLCLLNWVEQLPLVLWCGNWIKGIPKLIWAAAATLARVRMSRPVENCAQCDFCDQAPLLRNRPNSAIRCEIAISWAARSEPSRAAPNEHRMHLRADRRRCSSRVVQGRGFGPCSLPPEALKEALSADCWRDAWTMVSWA